MKNPQWKEGVMKKQPKAEGKRSKHDESSHSKTQKRPDNTQLMLPCRMTTLTSRPVQPGDSSTTLLLLNFVLIRRWMDLSSGTQWLEVKRQTSIELLSMCLYLVYWSLKISTSHELTEDERSETRIWTDLEGWRQQRITPIGTQEIPSYYHCCIYF